MPADTEVPVTTMAGVGRGWTNRPVTVQLSSTDPAGIALFQWAVDGGSWDASGTGPRVDVGSEGVNLVSAHALDNTGLAGPSRAGTVRIDTIRPVPVAPYSGWGRVGDLARIPYRIVDKRPGSPTATVTIEISALDGRLLRTVSAGRVSVNELHVCSFPWTLKAGTYRFAVYARDAAGNRQLAPAVNTLVVR